MRLLDLTGNHIANLGDEDLRVLVTKLCEAELQRNALPASAVLSGGNQTAKDGGIDVAVELDASISMTGMDFVPRPLTGFQVKCEDMPEGKIAAEMKPDGVLRDSIKELIAGSGAYVVVSSKGSVTKLVLGRRLKSMRAALAGEPGGDTLKIDFYDRDRLARWVRQYPGVEMWVRARVGVSLKGWQGYGVWAPGAEYILDETARLLERHQGGAPALLTIEAGMGRLRKVLNTPGQVSRLIGLSGTGKTRLVQALFEPGVGEGPTLERGRMLYTDIGHSPDPNAREMLVRLGESGQRAIVIVDNCNPSTHATLAQAVRQFPNFLSLLTVEYDVADDDSPEATEVFELAPSSEAVLDSILLRLVPHVNDSDRRRIIEFSGGNARIALALAGTVEQGEVLGTLNDADLFRRLFRQRQAEDENLLRAAEVCALVYSFDGDDAQSDGSELRVLGSLAGFSGRELYRHVAALKKRDLVQSRSKWRALLPPALANRLAKAALENIPHSDIVEAFANSDRLLISFSRRLEYLHDSDAARAIAARWMADEHWLSKPQELTPLGLKLFVNLAPLDPQKALAALARSFAGSGAIEFVERQQSNLSEWSALLRHLAYEPADFDVAAPMLLTLAELNKTTYVNCRENWHEPFRIALSGTNALPAQRIALLRRLMAISTGRRLELVWDAVEATLACNFINSSHDFSFGARPHGYGWEPSTGEEVRAWYEGAFDLLRVMEQSGPEGSKRAMTALATHFRELWRCGMHSELGVLARDFAAKSGWSAGWVEVRSTLRFDSKGMPADLVAALRQLESDLSPAGLLQEVRTYTLGPAGGYLGVADVLDDTDEEESQNPIDPWQRASDKVVALGDALAGQEEALRSVLPELFHEQQGRQFELGLGLGRASDEPLRHWAILCQTFSQASGEPNVSVLSGFASAVKAKDQTAHLEILRLAEAEAKLEPFYPLLVGLPFGDDDADRLIAAMHRRVASPYRFTLRTNLKGTPGFSLEKFCLAVQELSHMDGGLGAAIDQLSAELYFWKPDTAAVPVEFKQLGQALLNKFQFDTGNQMLAYRVNELAKIAFVGEEASAAAAQFASQFAVALEDYQTHGDEYGEIACTLFKLQPKVALEAFLTKPTKRKHFGFRSRFVARHGPVVQCAPVEVTIEWARADPEIRAPLLASEINIIATAENGATVLSHLANSLLEMVSNKGLVLKAFGGNFHPSHWSGSLAQTLAPFVTLAEDLLNHSDPLIASWASESLKAMRVRIEGDHHWESGREESFE
ncbi:hypothetical protein [Variovorax sp. LT1P1]|uniref:hypothetical protein n=1 Tax=Variovorax sp. LT1P1 TaxID=3443730 RepID=UPI003F49A3FB